MVRAGVGLVFLCRAAVGMNLLQIREICWRIAILVPMVTLSDDADSVRDVSKELGSDGKGTSFLCAAKRYVERIKRRDTAGGVSMWIGGNGKAPSAEALRYKL